MRTNGLPKRGGLAYNLDAASRRHPSLTPAPAGVFFWRNDGDLKLQRSHIGGRHLSGAE